MRVMAFVVSLCVVGTMSGCASGDIGFGVATTLLFDGAVADDELARVTHFQFKGSGDESFTSEIPLTRSAARTERTAYRPLLTTRTLGLSVLALDVSDQPVAIGQSGPLTLEAGKTTYAEIILGASSVGDGGAPDGADAAFAPGGPSHCGDLRQDPSVIACAGFENSGDELQAVSMVGATPLDTSRRYRGLSSIHLQTKGSTTSTRTLAEVHATSLPNAGFLAMRAFFYADAPSPEGTRLIDIQQGGAPYRSIEVGVDGNQHMRLTHSPPTGGTDLLIGSSQTLPLGRWVCLELQITWGGSGSGPPGRIRAFMDDVPLMALDDKSQNIDTPQLTVGIFGNFYDTSPGTDYEMWMDEIVIASAPIGCAK